MVSRPGEIPWSSGFRAVGWKTPTVLSSENLETAVDHLSGYLAHQDGKGPEYSGSYFEKLGGGGDREEIRNVITAEDLLSLQLLSIGVSGQVVLSLLTPLSEWDRPRTATDGTNRYHSPYQLPHNPEQISDLLAHISSDVPLSADGAEKHVKTANQLWFALRRKGFGPTAVFKLLARKRPRLLPVYDTYIASQLGTTSVKFYENLRTVLRHENHALANHLSTIRGEVPGAEHLSTLRVFDIIVWWAEHQRRRSA